MAALPLVVAPRTVVVVGSGGAGGTTRWLSDDVQRQALSDVQRMLRNITEQVLEEQRRAGNPAATTEVDGSTTKAIDAAQKKVVALFGAFLALAAMQIVEAALREAIQASTHTRTGRLAAVGGAWQWLFIPRGGAPRLVSMGAPLPAFQRGDQLVLRPTAVPYATRVNQLVAQSGRLTPKARMVKGALREPPRRLQNTGFLFRAAETLRRRSVFKQFNVRVVFSRSHMVPGEVMTRAQGTGMIVISPRLFVGKAPRG